MPFGIKHDICHVQVFLCTGGKKKPDKMLATEYSLYKENNLRVKSNGNLDLFKYLLQPHFLFNSLNNLYALSVSKSDKTSDAIVNLSQLLERVVSYSRFQTIPLKDEVQLIRDYIEMEKTWLGECSFLVDFRIKGDTESIVIPPLTIYTLVENAFKHGIRKCVNQSGWITINILVKPGRLYCKIRNSCPDDRSDNGSNNSKFGGVGLEAVKSVLNNLYKHKYILDSKQIDNVYCMDLLIEDTHSAGNKAVLKVL